MKKINLKFLLLGGIIASAILFAACNKNNDDKNNPDVAGLMAFNLSPDKTVYVGISGNSLTNVPLGYNNYTGGYIAIYPGSRTVTAYDYSSNDSVASATYDFMANKYYSSFLIGSNGNYQNLVVMDNLDTLSSSNSRAYVRYINAIDNSSNPTVTIMQNSSNVVSMGALYATVSDYVAVDPGDFNISIDGGASMMADRTITAQANTVYTILLTPGASPTDAPQIKYIVNGIVDNNENITSSFQADNME